MAKAAARTRKKSTARATKRPSATGQASRRSAKQARRKTPSAASAGRKATSQKRAANKRRARTTAAEPKPASSNPDTALTAAAAAVGSALGKTVEALARLPFRTNDHDAIKLLENDHRRLEALLQQGQEMSAGATSSRTRLLDTLTAELLVHEDLEEKLLYPALKVHAEAKEIVLEGYQEHHVADVLLNELHALAADDERWGAKFKVLKENLEHHIEEEEDEMFRIARSVLSREAREQLGERMQAMKMARS